MKPYLKLLKSCHDHLGSLWPSVKWRESGSALSNLKPWFSVGKRWIARVGLQIYKMINLGSNVIVYKLKHCVLHFEVNMMTF